MKPDWKEAPDWAQWVAMNPDGNWYWYEFQPLYKGESFECSTGRCLRVNVSPENWQLSREKRPSHEA